MFLCVVVSKGAQFDRFDWPRTLRSKVSNYNIDIHTQRIGKIRNVKKKPYKKVIFVDLVNQVLSVHMYRA